MTSWHAAAFCGAHPTRRPRRPRPQYRCGTNRSPWWTCFPSAPWPRPGGSDRSMLTYRFQGSTVESWSFKLSEHMSDTKLGTPSRNRLLTASTCLTTLLESRANNETTAPSNNPNLFLSKNVAAFSEAHHGRGGAVSDGGAWAGRRGLPQGMGKKTPVLT